MPATFQHFHQNEYLKSNKMSLAQEDITPMSFEDINHKRE